MDVVTEEGPDVQCLNLKEQGKTIGALVISQSLAVTRGGGRNRSHCFYFQPAKPIRTAAQAQGRACIRVWAMRRAMGAGCGWRQPALRYRQASAPGCWTRTRHLDRVGVATLLAWTIMGMTEDEDYVFELTVTEKGGVATVTEGSRVSVLHEGDST